MYTSLEESGCALLTMSPKRNSNDFIATVQILFHADIMEVKGESWQEARGKSELFIYNPWTSNRFFSKQNI
jgi:hypothetical protein